MRIVPLLLWRPRTSSEIHAVGEREHRLFKEFGCRLHIWRVDWGLPMLRADVCVLCYPPGFPAVPQYLGHTPVVPQPLTEPDKQLSHIRLFVQPSTGINRFIARPVLFGSMLSETPGAREPLSYNAVSRLARALGQHDRQSPRFTRSPGYVSDSGNTPFTSPNSRRQSSSSGRLDRPYPERLLRCS